MTKKLTILLLALAALGCSPRSADPVDYVNPFIGTGFHGHTYPGATTPFGMVQLSPDTRAGNWDACAGYHYSDTTIDGFSHTHLSGTGCADLADILFHPTTREIVIHDGECVLQPYFFSHDDERASCGYYAVTLPDVNIGVELTAAPRTGVHRYTFAGKGPRRVIVDLLHTVTEEKIDLCELRRTAPYELVGMRRTQGWVPDQYVFFAARFSEPFADVQLLGDKQAVLTFAPDVRTLTIAVGLSSVSVENARMNSLAEVPELDFDAVHARAVGQWRKALGDIVVEGGSRDEMTNFYTAQYHTKLTPNLMSDVNGEYMGADFRVHRSRSKQYTSFSNWDTYRTQIQLLSMLAPDVASDVVLSHQHFAEQSGGAFPRWVMANIETGIMQGDPTPILIANAWAFGAQDYDPFPLFQIMRRNAEVPGAKSQDVEERPGLKQYLEKGYYNASEQLEYTSSDFAIGQFALHACGDEFASWRYFHYARSWKNLYNPQTGWLQSRNADGSWKPLGEDWRESTYKNYFWMVPYDLAGLIETMGGKAAAEKRLDEFFVRLDAGYNDPWFASGNEPSFHIPWVYNWLGRPDKTSKVINRILNEQYTSAPDGLPGNDDLGTMGAWYVFACTGLYPMIPGVGGFTLSTPVFDKVVIHLKHGDITITGGSEKQIYTTALKLDGKPYGSTWIGWDALRNGATLEYTTSAKPSGNWGRTQLPPSYE